MIKYIFFAGFFVLTANTCSFQSENVDSKRLKVIEGWLGAIREYDSVKIYKNVDTDYFSDKEDLDFVIQGLRKCILYCKPQYNRVKIIKNAPVFSTVFFLPLCNTDTVVFRFPDYNHYFKIQHIAIHSGKRSELLELIGPPLIPQDTIKNE